jgi:DNA uptake protein ComE-like DNA-binding protein
MNSIRKWIRDIFGFSRTETNGFLILLPLTVVLILSEPLYHAWVASQGRERPGDAKRLDSLVAVWEAQVKKPDSEPVQQVSLFSFDPNTLNVEELQKLGFSEHLANRIAAYRLKGGVFRVKSDLMKIYGLDSTLYKQLYRYIRLPSSRLVLTESGKPQNRAQTEAFEKTQRSKTFDINTADTTLFKTIYGIGPRLAARIVKFREGLGGFIREAQLYEVYGLDSLVVERLLEVGFIKTDFTPSKININAADEEQLARHPYIRYKFASALMSYRFQHGDFQQVSDIKKLSAINAQDLERLLPYIKVND